MSKSHAASSAKFLDERGYVGPLIRGQAPYLLIEEAVRNRITNTYYFKEQCFGLNAATLCDRAAELTFVGGTFGRAQHASPFLCLAFKLLQLAPEREIVDAYLAQPDFKYLRALGAFYVRLTEERSEDVFRRLEPFLSDSRKLRRRLGEGYRLSFVDDFIDDLLTKDRVCGTSLWKLVPREQLEDEDKLEERVSPLQHLLDEEGSGRSRAGSEASSSSRRSRSPVRNGRRESSSGDERQRSRSENSGDRRPQRSPSEESRDQRRRRSPSEESREQRRRKSPSDESREQR